MAFFSNIMKSSVALGMYQGASATIEREDEAEKKKTDLYEKKVKDASDYAQRFTEKRRAKKKIENTGRKMVEASGAIQNLITQADLSVDDREALHAGLAQQWYARKSSDSRYTGAQFLGTIQNVWKTQGVEGLRRIFYTPPTVDEAPASADDPKEKSDMQRIFGAIANATPAGRGAANRQALEDSLRPTDPDGAAAYDRAMKGDTSSYVPTEPENLLPDAGKDPLKTRYQREEARTDLAHVMFREKVDTVLDRNTGQADFAVLGPDPEALMSIMTSRFYAFLRDNSGRYGSQGTRAAAEDFRALNEAFTKPEARKEGAAFVTFPNLTELVRKGGGIDQVLRDARDRDAVAAKTPQTTEEAEAAEPTVLEDVAEFFNWSASDKTDTDIDLKAAKVGTVIPNNQIPEDWRKMAKGGAKVGTVGKDKDGYPTKLTKDNGIITWVRG